MIANEGQLRQQYAYAKAQGWLTFFANSAAKYGFETHDLMAIASRESGMRNIKGDYRDGAYHGYSLMQLDIDSHRDFIESGKWKNPEFAIDEGARALRNKCQQISRAMQMPRAVIKFRSGKSATFVPKVATGDTLKMIQLSAYNCGLASLYHYSLGHDLDEGSTGKNYGRDVFHRSQMFKKFIETDPDHVDNDEAVLDDSQSADATTEQSAVQIEKSSFVDEVKDAATIQATQTATDRATQGVLNKLTGVSGNAFAGDADDEPSVSDLKDAAISKLDANKVKSGAKAAWSKAGAHIVAWCAALWNFGITGKIGLVIISLVILASTGYGIYHSRAALKRFALKLLK